MENNRTKDHVSREAVRNKEHVCNDEEGASGGAEPSGLGRVEPRMCLARHWNFLCAREGATPVVDDLIDVDPPAAVARLELADEVCCTEHGEGRQRVGWDSLTELVVQGNYPSIEPRIGDDFESEVRTGVDQLGIEGVRRTRGIWNLRAKQRAHGVEVLDVEGIAVFCVSRRNEWEVVDASLDLGPAEVDVCNE